MIAGLDSMRVCTRTLCAYVDVDNIGGSPYDIHVESKYRLLKPYIFTVALVPRRVWSLVGFCWNSYLCAGSIKAVIGNNKFVKL